MHRVELKEEISLSFAEAHLLFLMHRVELKAHIGSGFYHSH